jgi:predicted lipid-binding transport protein (Tim44 family)
VTRSDLSASLIDLVRKDKARKSRRKAFGKFMGALIQALLIAAMGGLWLMLAVGVIHHEWIAQCPTIGYGWATLLASLVRAALSASSVKSEAAR